MDGLKIGRVVRSSNADRIGLAAGDTIVRIDDRPVATGSDIVNSFQAHPAGSTVRFVVSRGGRELTVDGVFAPTPVAPDTTTIFKHRARSGRIDLQRTGNVVEATTRGIAEFTLLLSPGQFDLSQPVKVITNGHAAFEGTVEKNLPTLMKWAARDNDRTMLFAAEVRIKVR